MTTTALETYTRGTLGERARYAKSLAGAADLIPAGLRDGDTPNPAKILLVMETAAMLGLPPLAGIMGIDVIEGKAAISPQLMSGVIRARGHKLRIRKTGTVEGGDFSATVELVRADDPDGIIVDTWTPHRAARAGLCTYVQQANGVWKVTARSKYDKVLPWEAYTENLCVWRAMGVVGREGAADVLMGVSYFPEELGELVGEDGVRSETDADAERDYLDRMAAIDDKEDMRSLYREITRAEAWTNRLEAEFDSHLMTLTKDSKPKEPGAPGNTGEPDIDGSTDSATATAEPGAGDDVPASASESPAEAPNASTGHTAPEGETEEERFERESAEEFARVKATEEAAAAFADVEDVVDAEEVIEQTSGTLFDSGPRGGTR